MSAPVEIRIRADAAQANAALGTVRGSLTSLGRTAAVAAAAIGTATVAMGAALTAGLQAGVRASLAYADAMAKVSQRTGIATEDLSGLGHAAKLAGVSMEQLGVSLRGMTRWMEQTGQLGRPVIEVLEEQAELFARMPDGAEKVALAMERFGRAGESLIPLLNQGSAGIRMATREAQQLGLIVRNDTAKAAELFNDNLTRLRGAATGFALRITEHLLPSLTTLSQSLLAFATTQETSSRIWKALELGIGLVVARIESFIAGLRWISTFTATFVDSMVETGQITNSTSKAFDEAGKAVDRYRQALVDLIKQQGQPPPVPSPLGAGGDDPKDLTVTARFPPSYILAVRDAHELFRDSYDHTATLGEAAMAGWQESMIQLGTIAENVGRTISNTIGTAISSISSGITGLVTGTLTWGQALRQIGTSILNQVIDGVVRMFFAWMTQRKAAAAVEVSASATETAAKAPSALLTSIKTLGIAAAVGAAAFLAAMAITGGFQAGGYTGDGPPGQVAGVVHRGEFVVPAPAVERIGIDSLHAMVAGNHQPASGPSGPVSSPRLFLFLDRHELAAALQDDIEAQVIQVLRRHA